MGNLNPNYATIRTSSHSHIYSVLRAFETLQQTERQYNIRYMEYDDQKNVLMFFMNIQLMRVTNYEPKNLRKDKNINDM